ncbi:MAG: transposase [Eubacteriales bacterium]|nr:transposase [Eubacteriales bacterium]
MGGNYEKGMYHQLMDVMARLDAMETEHQKDRKEISSLTAEVKSLRKENTQLRAELVQVKEENATLQKENAALRKENQLLRDDNERMKRILGNDSTNSSVPPSTDQPGKAPNTYNSRKPTSKKAGAQPGHAGHHISKADVEKKIKEGVFAHTVMEIGDRSMPYITRYRLDLSVGTTAAEIRIHADKDGKYNIPDEYRADVSYGTTLKAIVAFLYSEGVVSNDRIATFLNSLSGDTLDISTGSIYHFCRGFSEGCAAVRPQIKEALLNAGKICTDATGIKRNGKQEYIRNFSTEDCVLYCGSEKKNIKTLEKFRIFQAFTGTLIHDHETALYHFGGAHGECNVHLARYLRKNTEETGNQWSHRLCSFLYGMNDARNRWIQQGRISLGEEETARYVARYEELVSLGWEQNKKTRGRIAKKEERALLNRLEKYKQNHLLFLYDFQVPFSNNMSEKDLRICKNRQKMAGGFRTVAGREMYCNIMSFIETIKRRKQNIFQSIIALMNGTPAIR